MNPLSGSLPLVSVALCTYNGSRFLPEQIHSLMALDYANLEFVVCDDASTDGTAELLKAWTDPRVRLYSNETRLGYNRNFAQCFARCSGVFIAPCDQDDRWQASKISRLLAALGDRDLVYCDSRLIDAGGTDLGQRFSATLRLGRLPRPARLPRRQFRLRARLPVSAAAAGSRRAHSDSLFYDWWLGYIAADRGGIGYLDEPLVEFRRHEAAATLGPAASHGNKLSRARERAERLRLFASRATGTERDAVARYAQLVTDREFRWLCPALAWFVWRHGRRLYRREPRALGGVIARRALEHFIGLRLRRLFSPKAYAALHAP